jgi:hypothetical protein
LTSKAVAVTHTTPCLPALEAAVAAAGYPVAAPTAPASTATAPLTTVLTVPGMMCMRNCGSKVKAALMAVAGVQGVCVPTALPALAGAPHPMC